MRRALTPFVASLLLLSACSSKPAPPKSAGKSSGTASASPGASRSSASSPTASASPAGGTTQSYPDNGGPGDLARSILRGSPARRLIVEVDWVTGMEPARSALDHLSQVLQGVVDKSGGVSVERGHAFSSSKGSYSVADIQAIERRERRHHSGGDTVTVWIAYLDGQYSDGQGTLGVTYSASATAIFRQQLDNATTALVLEPAIEAAVITHEVGHILALVNLGYKSPRNHEDAAHPHHSSNKNSVMYWQVEDVSIAALLNGGPPSNFDADDKADLEMLKAGG